MPNVGSSQAPLAAPVPGTAVASVRLSMPRESSPQLACGHSPPRPARRDFHPPQLIGEISAGLDLPDGADGAGGAVCRGGRPGVPREVRVSVAMPIHFSIFTSRSSNQQIPFPAIWR